MGRKIKSVLLLILVLALIYWQHSVALYAEEPGESAENPGESFEEQENPEESFEEQENPEESFEEQELPEEEPEEILKYEVAYEKADGQNGYYITAPAVTITHVSGRGSTVYVLKHGGAVKAEGALSEKGKEAVLSGELFEEGKNILDIYMEDETGKSIDEYKQSIEFSLDTKAPVCEVSAPSGFGVWYQKEVWIRAEAYDGEEGSQPDTISCYCGNELVGLAKGAGGDFCITCPSAAGKALDITIIASDKAGNKTEAVRQLYIDNYAPDISIEGFADYMITSKAVPVICNISEENVLQECKAEVEWENPKGEKQFVSTGEWTKEEQGQTWAFTAEENGVYRIKVSAADAAGHRSTQEAQFIIDNENPVIRYVDMLEGRHMKKFCWNYEKEAFIEDFTTYAYEIRLDEKIYPVGEEIEEEGPHMLKVTAVDAAGNEAQARAGFIVDHTPPEIVFADVEEGESYEEEKTFRITVNNPEDEIQQVWINGVLKPQGSKRSTGQYTVRECKGYEVFVRARDKAGNQRTSDITFQVVPKETVLEKAAKPLKIIFTGRDEPKYNEQKYEKETGKRSGGLFVSAGVFTACAVCAALIFRRRKKRKNSP